MSALRERLLRDKEKGDLDPDIPAGNGEFDSKLQSFLGEIESRDKPPSDYYAPGRAAAQGFSMGLSDEMFAGARYPFTGKTYEEELQYERDRLAQSYEDNPAKTGAAEFGGALTLGALTAPVTGGLSLPITMGRMALTSGLMGGGYGFNTGEGGFTNRLSNVLIPAATSAVGGPIAGMAVKGLGAIVGKLTDSGRRMFGDKPAAAVEAEIQRIARDTGMTTDEIVTRINKGEILAEMSDSTRNTARAYYAEGGPGSQRIYDVISPRAGVKSDVAFSGLKKSLGGDAGENLLMTVSKSADDLKKLEGQAYKEVFKKNPFVSQREQNTLRTILSNEPEILKDSAEVFRSMSGKKPFFEVSDSGKVKFTRNPSLEEAEIVRRILNDKANKAFRDGKGTIGGATKALESRLRDRLDSVYPELRATRQNWSKIMKDKEVFEMGRKALSKSSDEVELELSKLPEESLDMYRRGLAVAVDKARGTRSGKSLPGRIADTDTRESKIIDMVLPGNTKDEIFEQMSQAAKAQATRNRVLGGSQTAQTLAERGRMGMDGAVSDAVMASQGEMFAAGRLLKRVFDKGMSKMNEAQKEKVIDILLTENPEMVRRALTDESAMRSLIEYGNRLVGPR